jgi:hypothetical protein
MKKIIIIIGLVLTIQNSMANKNITFANNRGSTISTNTIDETKLRLRVGGNFPEVNNIRNAALNQAINQRLQTIFQTRVAIAQASNSTNITFDYKYSSRNGIYSIVIYSTINSGTVREMADTITFDTNTNRILTINDVLGTNGTKIVYNHVNSQINNNPQIYRSNFSSIQNNQDFYLENGVMYIIFNQNEISNTLKGVHEGFSIVVNDVVDVTLNKNQYRVEQDYGLKLVPLRKVAQGLGHTVNWNERNRTVDVIKGEVTATISLDRNEYTRTVRSGRATAGNITTRELESKPTIVNGVMYVPISFFEIILRDTYTVANNGQITISTYSN